MTSMNRQIGNKLTVSALIAAAALMAALVVAGDVPEINMIWFYEDKLRGALFGGFLTLAGFLFSLKTFIVIKMKENVYDHDFYEKLVNERKVHNEKITRYGPLKNLSDLLFWSVLLSFVSAIFQFSLGLLGNLWAVYACLWISIFTVITFFISLFAMQTNLNTWFEHLEKAEKQKAKEANKKANK